MYIIVRLVTNTSYMYLYKYSYDDILYKMDNFSSYSLQNNLIKHTNFTSNVSGKYFDNKNIFDMPYVEQYGNHMVMKNCNNNTRKIYVNFDTRFSNDLVGEGGIANNHSDYYFTLPIRLTNIKSMSVTNVEVSLSYFNISAAFGNNMFCIKNIVTENTITISLSDGQYTYSKLQSYINSLLPSGITFSINSQGQSVFTNMDFNGIEYNLDFYTNTVVDGFDKNNPKFKLGWLLGFRYTSYSLSYGESLISECIINLNGPRYLYLIVDEFQNGKENTFNSVVSSLVLNIDSINSNSICETTKLCNKASLITTIPNNKLNSLISSSILKKNILARITSSCKDYLYGTILPANLSNGLLLSDKRTYNHGKVDIQRLNVQLVNEIGQVINLNGGHVMFCLEFEVTDEN